jgi:MFS family permease
MMKEQLSTKKNFTAMNIGTFFCLYIAQYIPMTFIMTALQVTMRQDHYSLSAIGLLNLVKLPWQFKFLWSPFIDRHCLTSGDFKRAIISSETIYALSVILIGFLDLGHDLYMVLILVFISMLASATQDNITDAFAILSFDKSERGNLNGWRSMGRYAGSFVGSGVLIMMLHSYGWKVIFPCLGFFTFILAVPLILNKHIRIKEKSRKQKAKLADFIWFFSQRQIWPQIGFLLLYFVGILGILSMIRPYMVDKGFNLKEIGFMIGIIGTIGSILMAWIAGKLVHRLGIHRSRILVAVMIILAPLYFLGMSMTATTMVTLIIGILYLKICHASASIVVYTSAMDCVREGREATDFAVQVAIIHFTGMLIAVLAGPVGQLFDYQGLFIIEAVIAVISLIYVLIVFKNKK